MRILNRHGLQNDEVRGASQATTLLPKRSGLFSFPFQHPVVLYFVVDGIYGRKRIWL